MKTACKYDNHVMFVRPFHWPCCVRCAVCAVTLSCSRLFIALASWSVAFPLLLSSFLLSSLLSSSLLSSSPLLSSLHFLFSLPFPFPFPSLFPFLHVLPINTPFPFFSSLSFHSYPLPPSLSFSLFSFAQLSSPFKWSLYISYYFLHFNLPFVFSKNLLQANRVIKPSPFLGATVVFQIYSGI